MRYEIQQYEAASIQAAKGNKTGICGLPAYGIHPDQPGTYPELD